MTSFTLRQKSAVELFVEARLACHKIMELISKTEGLPDIYRAQAKTISSLAGLELHRIVGEADDADFLALRDDLEVIADKVDPLISQIGREAASNSHHIERELFERQLFGALDGNALGNLDTVADEMRAELIAAE